MKKYAMLVMAVVLSLFGTAQPPMAEHPSTTERIASATAHREIGFTASPERLYEALLD